MNLEIGIRHSTYKLVDFKDTAAAYGSGLVEVFATPAMIAMMENTCLESIQSRLDEGFTTVGTAVDIRHMKATPKGKKVTCSSWLKEISGKKLIFEVEAHDEVGLIGTGTHKRFVVNNNEFMQSLA